MDMTEEYSDRIMCLEAARKFAEQNYDRNPQDADNLTRWAGSLLELSNFHQNITDSKKMIIEAIPKLEEALLLSPKKPDALWFLGNAHTSFAFLTPEIDVARDSFDKAALFYKQAVQEEPTNVLYLKYLQMNIEARELHMEIYKGGLGQQLMGGGGGSSVSSNSKNLTRRAGALFELSMPPNKTKLKEMKKDAISKLDKALSLNSENHYILWCLGNVYCSLAKSYPVGDTSTMYFDKAYGYFKKALDKDPENERYLMSKQKFEQRHKHYFKEMSDNNKAPEPHMETHKNGLGLVGESSGSSNPKAAKKPKSSNLMHGTLGCVILAVGIFALIQIAKSRVPPPPPR